MYTIRLVVYDCHSGVYNCLNVKQFLFNNSMVNVEKRHSHARSVNNIRQPDNRIRQIVSYKSAFKVLSVCKDVKIPVTGVMFNVEPLMAISSVNT